MPHQEIEAQSFETKRCQFLIYISGFLLNLCIAFLMMTLLEQAKKAISIEVCVALLFLVLGNLPIIQLQLALKYQQILYLYVGLTNVCMMCMALLLLFVQQDIYLSVFYVGVLGSVLLLIKTLNTR